MNRIILALPKSASTSLMEAVGSLSGLPVDQLGTRRAIKPKSGAVAKAGFAFSEAARAGWARIDPRFMRDQRLRSAYPSEDFKAIASIHRDVCDLSRDGISITRYLAASGKIHKQHFPPTFHNRVLFETWKKVVLVRDVSEILPAYERMIAAAPSRPAWAEFFASETFRTRLVEELNAWVDGWTHEPNALTIWQKDLIARPAETMRQVFEFYEMPVSVPDTYVLPRERYTKSVD